MTETNQKLREALQLIAWSNDSKWQADCARQALALPTAEQVDDINVAESFTSVTKTAAPVCEREAFEREMRCEEEWGHRSLKKRQNGKYENWQVDLMWDVWQARAALSAGDAVLADREACAKLCEEVADDLITAMRKEGETDDEVMTSLVASARVCAEEIRGGYSKKFNPHNAAIDAAMRKDKT